MSTVCTSNRQSAEFLSVLFFSTPTEPDWRSLGPTWFRQSLPESFSCVLCVEDEETKASLPSCPRSLVLRSRNDCSLKEKKKKKRMRVCRDG